MVGVGPGCEGPVVPGKLHAWAATSSARLTRAGRIFMDFLRKPVNLVPARDGRAVYRFA